MPTQEQNALIRYEALKEIIKIKKKVDGEYIFAYMFNEYGILERTTSRYLKYLKELGFIETKGSQILWIKKK